MEPFYTTTFRTMDGTELNGRVYPSSTPGPGVVMCPGFNCTLAMLNFPTLATTLQKTHNMTILLYDPRSIGSSSGVPRNEINPPQSVSDLSDALTHLSNLPAVSSNKRTGTGLGLGLLGFSFGGSVSLTAACVDPRVTFVIAIAPLTDMAFFSPEHRYNTLEECVRDRESQVLGNPPFTVPLINEVGENSVGFGHVDGITGEKRELYARMVSSSSTQGAGGRDREIAPGHVNRVTLRTYYMLAMWTPWSLWRTGLGSSSSFETGSSSGEQRGGGGGGGGLKGVMFVVPGEDKMSYPELQRRCFDEIGGGESGDGDTGLVKRILEVDGVAHEDVLAGESLGRVAGAISDFFRDIGLVTEDAEDDFMV